MAALQLEREVEQFAGAKVLLDFEELNPFFGSFFSSMKISIASFLYYHCL